MKPRTKQQQLIYGLSVQLPKLTEAQRLWALKHCLRHVGYRTKKNISCLDCGHIWVGPQKVKSCECPSCGVKLTIEDTRKKKLHQESFLALLDVRGGFQVNRFFDIQVNHKAGEKPGIFIWEVVQQWMAPDVKSEVVARNRAWNWNLYGFNGDLEIRDRRSIPEKYNLCPDKVMPGWKCLQVYKRNGFKGKFGEVPPYELFNTIVDDNRAETLLKAGQFSLLKASINSRRGSINRYWSSVKICIRNKYIVEDGITWLDYLDLLQYFRKDLHSPKYVCPANLKDAHDRLVVKRREFERRRAIESKKRQIEEDQLAYTEDKQAYFGIAFTQGDLTIKVLETIQEFIEEAEAHRHCVYSNAYYRKENSLILSARIDGKPVETIEVSLSEMKIVQSRGLRNEATEYNQQILDLLTRNLHVIQKRYKELNQKAA